MLQAEGAEYLEIVRLAANCPGPGRNPCANSCRASLIANGSATRVCRRLPRRHIEEQRAGLTH
eukprot:12247443-Alexandrium_andersonii.AAC.1